MTPLQALILQQLHKCGPMRDVELWQHTTEVALSPITMACLSLEEDGYIEIPRVVRPVSFEWQITTKGTDYVVNHLSRSKANV